MMQSKKPKKSKKFTDLEEAALVIRDRQGRILMRRCATDERWAGLWDFPRFDITGHLGGSGCAAFRKRLAVLFQERFGRPILIGKELHKLKHAVTRYRITLNSFEAQIDDCLKTDWRSAIEIEWADHDRLAELALSSSGKKLWLLLNGPR